MNRLVWNNELNGWECRDNETSIRVMKLDAARCFVYMQTLTPNADALYPELAGIKKMPVTDLGTAMKRAVQLIEKYHGEAS